ncbi:MAG: DUF7691 family protein [Dermatophilaceae bacterium]
MSYTWSAYALDVDALVSELRTPTLASSTIRIHPNDTVLEEAIQRWDTLAATIAGALADGEGGNIGGYLANYVALVVQTLGTYTSSAGHTSSGGEWFREELLGRDVAAIIGEAATEHLIWRELDTLTMVDDTRLGWLTVDECQEAAERIEAFEPDDDTEEDLWEILDGITGAARRSTGVVTIYG